MYPEFYDNDSITLLLKRVNIARQIFSTIEIGLIFKYNKFVKGGGVVATIKDIAREAGVAQGTVSNVLNGKGNVSSDKIRLVEEAAAKLGYTINRRAKLLRKGASNSLAVLLPNMYDRHYTDFFLSFKHYGESCGYSVSLYLSADNIENEQAQLAAIRSEGMAGLAAFSCSPQNGPDIYASAGFSPNELVFIERDHGEGYSYLGFQYGDAGRVLACKAIEKEYREIALVTESLEFSCEREFYDSFSAVLDPSPCHVRTIQTDKLHCNNHFLQLLNEKLELDAVFVTNYGLAQAFANVQQTFYRECKSDVYTISPLFTMPSKDFKKYELNYRLLGKTAAEQLISQHHSPQSACRNIILENDGIRSWIAGARPSSRGKSITVLTLDSPTARIMESLAKLYTDATGVGVKIAISSYDGVHEILKDLGDMAMFDVIRLDHTWLSWFGKKIFTPLETLDPELRQTLKHFIPGLIPKYSNVGDTLYALPETPNAQLLFYRRDLFENVALQRLYKEQYKRELVPPEDYASFNQIARFFTKKFNPASPVTYGTTLTIGNSGVAATEYLTRYFSHASDLFSSDGDILLEQPQGLAAMRELVEARPCAPTKYNDWWRGTAREFAQGDTAMTVLFSNYASEMLNADSRITDKIGYAVVPGANPLIGGGTIGVCRNSKNPQEAMDFIRWVCSEEVTAAMTLLGSVSPCRKTYENYEVLDTYPWLALSRDCISLSHTNRIPPNLSTHFDERRFLSILGMAVNNAISGTMSAEEALSFAAQAYRHSFLCAE
jgi:multiple sugar transport system substrate-binding protein